MQEKADRNRLRKKKSGLPLILLLYTVYFLALPFSGDTQELNPRREAARKAAEIIDSWAHTLEDSVQKLALRTFKGDEDDEFLVALIGELAKRNYYLEFNRGLEKRIKKALGKTQNNIYESALSLGKFRPPQVIVEGRMLDFDTGRVRLEMGYIQKNDQYSATVFGEPYANFLAKRIFMAAIIAFVIMAACRFFAVTLGFFQGFIYTLGLIISLTIAWFVLLQHLDFARWLHLS